MRVLILGACGCGAVGGRITGFGDGEAGIVNVSLGEVGFFDHAVDERCVRACKVFLHEFGQEVVAAQVHVFSYP